MRHSGVLSRVANCSTIFTSAHFLHLSVTFDFLLLFLSYKFIHSFLSCFPVFLVPSWSLGIVFISPQWVLIISLRLSQHHQGKHRARALSFSPHSITNEFYYLMLSIAINTRGLLCTTFDRTAAPYVAGIRVQEHNEPSRTFQRLPFVRVILFARVIIRNLRWFKISTDKFSFSPLKFSQIRKIDRWKPHSEPPVKKKQLWWDFS